MQKALVILASFFCVNSFAQQTSFLNDPDRKFNQAKEYFQREQYSLAYPLLKDLEIQQREADRSNRSLRYQEIKYYSIVSALKQNEEQAVDLARDFITLEDNAARVQMMSFHLAEYYFRQQQYANAIMLYEDVSLENLNNKEVADLKFHLGYSYFTSKQFSQAKPLLNSIRLLSKDPNYHEANYYYGFISFYEQKYRDALEAFSVVQDHDNFGTVVPYYIANIYYSLGEKDKAIEYAEAKLKRGNLYYEAELRQLVGHGYFEKKQFDKAVSNLEVYVQQVEKVSREDMYELAFSYYQTGNLTKAIDGFKQLSGKEDSLAQNAMYLLADAYLKTGQKANARNAFLFCASNSSNLPQKEISQFNYAKLSYELGYQDVALAEFQKFVAAYPSSDYIVEARELLMGVLANTNNFKDALAMVNEMNGTSQNSKQLIPRILYGRATELINDGLLDEANLLLTRAEREQSRSLLPLVQFWKGEISFRQGRIDEAIRYFFEYLKSPVSEGEATPTNARYSLGYCFLKKENFRQALGFFEQVVSSPKINSPLLEQDAYLRAADCHFMNRDFKKARAMYDKVLEYSWAGGDYATFQKAMIEGVSNSKAKVNLLSSLSRLYPTSPLIADANFEIAGTYLGNEQFREAIPYLKNVISDPSQGLKPKAHLRLGIVFYNLENNKDALDQYTTLLRNYPNTPEAEAALENARAIYVEEGRTGEYVQFARSMGKDITASQEDELAYEEAETQFTNGNFAAAARKFEEYLSKFPDGKHSLEALNYKSDIYFNQKDWARAVAGYEILADRAPHKFGERSLLLAARINFFDLRKYDKAEKYFEKLKSFASNQETKLEAMRGLLRSQFQLQKWTDAADNAKELLSEKNIGSDDKVLAHMAIAKSHQAANEFEAAITNYRSVAALSKSAYGAEARYEIAKSYFSQNRWSDAEKAAFEVINKNGSYEQWVTRAYILLGDVYFKQKDYFNAKATFQSVVDNAKIEELRIEAEKKLNQVIEAEKQESKLDTNP